MHALYRRLLRPALVAAYRHARRLLPSRVRAALEFAAGGPEPVAVDVLLSPGATLPGIHTPHVHVRPAPPPAAPREPDLVSVVVLGGHDDATAAALAAQDRPADEVVTDVAEAAHPLLAFTTAGAIPDAAWLARLVAAFGDLWTEVVIGGVTHGSRRADRALGGVGPRVEAGLVLPDPANFAVRASTLAAAHAGDPRDAAFGARLRRAGGLWAYVPGAAVTDGVADLASRVASAGESDAAAGERAPLGLRAGLLAAAAGLGLAAVALALLALRGGAIAWLPIVLCGAGLGALALVHVVTGHPFGFSRTNVAFLLGRRRGRRERRNRAARRLDGSTGTALVLAGVPIDDVGGGSRFAQMAHELLRRGLHVTYVFLYPKAETVDVGLRVTHARFDHVAFGDFEARAYAGTMLGHGGADLVVLQYPAPAFWPAVHAARATGATVVYDYLDRWDDPALGGAWYDAAAEDRFVAAAHALVGSAPDLVDHLAARSGRAVALLPNAVNAHLFTPAAGRLGAPPADFPSLPGPVAGYVGSLYGDWFDWPLLAAFAAAWPGPVVVIGDPRAVPAGQPPNVHFLGLKPWPLLPGYVSRFTIGLVPFTVTDTTHAVSPLKVYEYLAAGVPVLAPPLRSLAGVPGVHLVPPEQWPGVGPELADAELDPAVPEHIRNHESWTARVDALLRHAGFGPLPDDHPGPTLRVRSLQRAEGYHSPIPSTSEDA